MIDAAEDVDLVQSADGGVRDAAELGDCGDATVGCETIGAEGEGLDGGEEDCVWLCGG